MVLFGFNTQPPEGGWQQPHYKYTYHKRFNTQPPEGGWDNWQQGQDYLARFNTQPPEGGWFKFSFFMDKRWIRFNTQPPEGGWFVGSKSGQMVDVSTHSRPKAAGSKGLYQQAWVLVSTHSRPKAAGFPLIGSQSVLHGFNTQPPEGGWGGIFFLPSSPFLFQHTAARRRLARTDKLAIDARSVSTHSRPKAAGRFFC